MKTYTEGQFIAEGEIYKLRKDGKCMVVYSHFDLGCKARIKLLGDDGRWMTVGYFSELSQAMIAYFSKYDM